MTEGIAGEITGKAIDLICLMSPGQDPHSYRLKPSDRAAIEGADLVLDHGYDLAPSLTEILQAASSKRASMTIVAVAEQAVPEPLLFDGHGHHHEEEEHTGEMHEEHEEHEEGEHHEVQDHEHAEGEDESPELVPDPHVWHDPRNGQAMVTVIADQLTTLDPEHTTDYSANAADLRDRLATLHGWIGQQIATIPEGDRQLVTTHDAFGYFAAAYNVVQNSALSGLNPQEKPSPAQLAAIVEQVKASGAPAIFAENTLSTTLIEAVAKDAGIRVAETPLLVDSPDPTIANAADYPAMLAYNTCVIVGALGGECDRSGLGF
jgi:manganese/iron transport system substrate-binding protein